MPPYSIQEGTHADEPEEYPQHRFFSLHPGVVETDMTRSHKVTTNYNWHMDSPELPAGTALWLTTSEADFLRARTISANWRMDDLMKQKEQIEGEGLLKTGLSGKLGL